MSQTESEPRSIVDGTTIESKSVPAIRIPRAADTVDQTEEWCEVCVDGDWRRVRFHDYDEIFAIPGLYETLFHDTLECASPERVVAMLAACIEDAFEKPEGLRVLDVGAGNGLVGERLRDLGVESIVGVDIIPEARDAALRDRPGLYDEYLACDLTALTERQRRSLEEHRCNAMTTVAALGFNDIPPRAFAAAYNLLEAPAWVAFNLNENFLDGADDSGFARLVRAMQRDGVLETSAYQRYPHRLGIDGEWLRYVAIIGRKLRDIPEDMLAEAEG
ncbi:MAG: methyltransferase [Phycisphaerales bacterium]|nr:MAG: methyltransferase [Phycisphaerales bacterium]